MQPAPQDPVGRLCLAVRVGPGVHERPHGLVTVEVRERHLELVRRRTALDAGEAHAVLPRLRQADGREIGDAIGCDVGRGIPHLVHELLGDARHADAAAGVRVLGDLEAAVRMGFHDRVADVREVRDALPVHAAIAPAALGAALDGVARNGAGGELVPVVGAPAEGVHHGREREPGIGDPSGDDDVRSLTQRLNERRRAEVGVGREHAVANLAERAARVEVLQVVAPREQAIEPGQEVVARDDADPQLAAEAELPRRRGHRLRAGARVHAPGVRRHLHPPLHEQRQDPLHLGDEVLGVARGGVAGLLLLEDRHRDFGEVVHHQVVDGPPGHLAVGRLQPVSPEPLARGDAHGPTRCPHGRAADNGTRRTASAPVPPPGA